MIPRLKGERNREREGEGDTEETTEEEKELDPERGKETEKDRFEEGGGFFATVWDSLTFSGNPTQSLKPAFR